MALFDLFKPKWKRRNPEARLAAVQAMGGWELATLKSLATGDEDARVQLAAVERIGDRETLGELAGMSLPPQVLRAVRAKFDLQCFQAVIAGSDSPATVADLGRIEDPELLERLAAEAPAPALRVRAVERIADPQALCRILERNCGKDAGKAALARIEDEELLGRVARYGASKVTRRLAEEKLAARVAEREEPARRALRDRELEGLVAAAEELASAPAPEEAAGRLVSLRLAWERLDPDRAHPRWTAFLNATQGFEARREEARRLREDERRRQEEERLHQEEERRRRDEEGRRARNSETASGAGQEAPAEGSRRRMPAEEAERAEADLSARREEVCAELEGLAEAQDRASAARRVRELRRTWKKLKELGPAAVGGSDERFRAAEERFAARQEAFEQQQDWLRWNNKALKEGLCAEAEGLDAVGDLEALVGKVKELQRRWKEVGPVPRADADALWERFKAACDRAFERCRPHLEELERRRTEAVERKEALCSEAEAHADSTDWKGSAEALKGLQAQWKEAGQLPRRREDELRGRFRRACDAFFERRQAHFAELDEQRRGRQAEKEKLCEQAEALAAEPARERRGEVRRLQSEWKRVGPAPREAEQALWERFRSACDRYFDALGDGRLENLRRKEALCEEFEALAAAPPKGGPAALADFQARWAEIGPVPSDRAEALGDRFRALCEAFAAAGAQTGP